MKDVLENIVLFAFAGLVFYVAWGLLAYNSIGGN